MSSSALPARPPRAEPKPSPTARVHELHERALGSAPELRRYDDVRELIASPNNPTPLVRLNHLVPPGRFSMFLKLEWMNPFGSIKDRTARALLAGMAERGELDGKELVEPSSGNTGIALAAIAALMGKKITITIPDAVPNEKKVILEMLGATVMETPDDLCPRNHPKDGAIALAHSIAESPASQGRYAMPNQYENEDNVAAHYTTTGPEIWAQTEGRVRFFIAGYGTCGTLTGVGRFLKERDDSIRVIAIEPQRNHRLAGLKNLEEAKTPSILDTSVVDEVIRVDDTPAYETTRRLFREEGLIVGPSTGAIVWAARELAARESGIAVGVSPDSGFKYGSFFSEILGRQE